MAIVEASIRCKGLTVDELRDELWNLHMNGYGNMVPNFSVGGSTGVNLDIMVTKPVPAEPISGKPG